MRILHFAYRDTSGVPGRWAAAHRAAGHETRLLVELPHPYGYVAPHTSVRWSPEGPDAIAGLLDWAEAIMAYDHPVYLETAIDTGKPVLFRALGSSSRDHHEEIRLLLEAQNVVRATTGTGDLALLLDLDLVGAPYGLLAPAPGRGRVICHAPSDRAWKGTESVLRAAAATGWDVDLVEDATNDEVLQRKRRATLVVDSIGPGSIPDGYGVNGVEAMAMSLPVVTSASGPVAELLRHAGAPVVFAGDEDELKTALEWLTSDTLRADLGHQGRAFVEAFHSGADRAAEDAEALALVAA